MYCCREKLGSLLGRVRKARGVTQQQIADFLGTSAQFVSDVENLRKNVSNFRLVFGWSTYLGISIAQIMNTTEDL